METNRFMQPAQQQVMSNYVPIPFEALAQAGAVNQQRYERAITAEQGMEDLLTSVRGASTVNTMNMGSQDAYGQARVDAETNKFRDRIGNLQKENPDFTSMSYQAGLRSTYNAIKRSMTTGVLGKEAANYAAIQEVYKNRAANADVTMDKSLAYASDRQLMDYASYGADADAPVFTSNVGFGKYVDLNTEMNSVLKDIKETMGAEGFTGSGLKEYTRWVKHKGVSNNRVLVVANERLNDPRIANTIANRAGVAAMREGDTSTKNIEKHANKIKLGLLTSATSTFVRASEVSKFLKTANSAGDNLSRPVTMGVKGWEDYDIGSTMNKIKDYTDNIRTAQITKDKLIKQYGINPDTNLDKDGIDRTRLMEYYDRQVEASKTQYEQLYNNVKEGMKVSGFSKSDLEEFDNLLKGGESLGHMAGQSGDEYVNTRNINQTAFGIKNSRKEFVEIVNKQYGTNFKSFEEVKDYKLKTNEGPSNTISNWFTFKNIADNSRFKKYMKSKYGDRGIELNINSIDGSLKNNALLKLSSFNKSFQNSIADIKDVTTGESWGSKDFDKFDPTKATLTGWAYDPATGRPTLVYSVPSRTGESGDGGGKMVKVEPPDGFNSIIAAAGQLKGLDSMINSQIMDVTKGIQSDKGRKEGVQVNLAGSTLFGGSTLKELQKSYDIDSKEDLDFDVKIEDPSKTSIEGEWAVHIPKINDDGYVGTTSLPARSIGEASRIAQDAYGIYLQSIEKK